MEKFNAQIKNFFEENKSSLINSYPGLNYNRFRQEFRDFLGLNLPAYKEERTEVFPDQEKIETFQRETLRGVPFQYLHGKAHFFNSEFKVDHTVLIPRPETEQLVEKAIHALKKWKKNNKDQVPTILDCGTGSGAIIISILQSLGFEVKAFASDLSPKALEMAKTNYFNLEYTIPKGSTLEFIEGDRLDPFISKHQKFDFIISNPPYIKEIKDKDLVHWQVHQFEPHSALYLKDEEYEEWFIKFFNQIKTQLRPNGLFLMEGHENNLGALKVLAERVGLKQVILGKDYSKSVRFLEAHSPDLLQ